MNGWMHRLTDEWMGTWMDRQMDKSYHVKNSKDICGYILMAMIVHHVAVDHHQRLHIQFLVRMRFKCSGSLPSGHGLIFIRKNIDILLRRFRHI